MTPQRPHRRAIAIHAILCLLTFSVLAQQNNINLDQAKAAMIQGIDATNKGDLSTAESAFARAVSLAPQVSATHAALGAVYLDEGKIDLAEKELDQAHALAPADASIDLNLARAEVASAHYDTALGLFHQALATPSAPQLSTPETIAYAATLSATGDIAMAQSTLAAALTNTPNSAQLHDAYGTLLAQHENLAQALPQFQQAVSLDPTLSDAQYHLGTTLLALNQADASIAPLKLAVEATPNSFDPHLQLGRALSAQGNDTDALDQLHRGAELSTNVTNLRALYALALALQASGDAAGSLPIFARATNNSNAWKPADYSSALTNYALAHVQTGDAKGAIQLYAQALSIGPDVPTLREDYGAAYLQEQELDHAIEQFRAGLALEPNDPHLHYDLGLALKLKDNLAAAVPEFEHAAKLDPSLPDPPYTLGVIYMQQGRFADSATQLQHAVALQPSNGDAWGLLGSVLRDSGNPTGAMEALKRAIALQPDQPNLHVEVAALEVQAGLKEEAAAERKIAADLSRAAVSRQRASFALKSGRALLAENKLDDAIVQLNTAVQAAPNSAEAHQLLADAYTRQGKTADAALERSRAAALATPPAK
ncbi:tetratricopeptide repeat protein [Granulicella sp. 5B5]|uniref:tetratricopeptide repeat protein n=1 Tax=Granulicella sp. 5B5 TaxID=1617967 RepID=UPI0015F482E2|nr:tetratricopeptide repeat protein [Granulicella sp. 5B5]QMV18627.1 tetratricopeptide repeat protein [Granulicella sp. 5B5]